MINRNSSKKFDVYEVQSLFLLASLFRYDAVMQSIGAKHRTRIILLEIVPVIDSTGLRDLTIFCKTCKNRNINIILSGVSPQVLNAISTSELKDLIGSDNIFQDTKMAFQKADELSSEDSF